MTKALPSKFIPSIDAAKQFGSRHRGVSYEGVSAENTDGINRRMETWKLEFKALSTIDADELDSFFKRRLGAEAISWVPPDETIALLWLCVDYEYEILSTYFGSISATFERTYLD